MQVYPTYLWWVWHRLTSFDIWSFRFDIHHLIEILRFLPNWLGEKTCKKIGDSHVFANLYKFTTIFKKNTYTVNESYSKPLVKKPVPPQKKGRSAKVHRTFTGSAWISACDSYALCWRKTGSHALNSILRRCLHPLNLANLPQLNIQFLKETAPCSSYVPLLRAANSLFHHDCSCIQNRSF